MPADNPVRGMFISAALLAAFAIAGVATVAFIQERTAGQIAANERARLLETLTQVLPADRYDNTLIDDAIEVRDARLGTASPVTVYRAFRNGEPVAALFRTVAPDGYSGDIFLLVGVYANGRVSGVRVLSHKETPGLGDPIEIERSDWITRFDGRSLDDPALPRWDVRRHGGEFDQFTGATITPRAVVKAVKNTLLYFREHRDEIFATP